jgi:ketosteroid isomerase-like protein
MRTRRVPYLAGLFAVVTFAACSSAPSVATQGSAQDETAIRGLADKFVAAFNANNAAGIAAIVTDDYRSVAADGTAINGKAGVEKSESEAVQLRQKMNLNLTLSVSTDFLQWIDASNATIGGTWSITGAPGGSPNKGSWMGVAHKSAGGEWLLSSSLAADYVAPPLPAPAPAK